MSDVVRASGLGRGTVYRHFGSLAGLVTAHLAEEHAALLQQARDSEDPARALNVLLRDMRRLIEAHLSVLTPDITASDEAAKLRAAFHATVLDLLGQIAAPATPRSLLHFRADLLARVADPAHLAATSPPLMADAAVAAVQDLI